MASAKTPKGPHILTANTLLTGRTVFWAADGWSRSPDDAIRADTPEEVAELEARGEAEEFVNMVVGAYLVSLSENGQVEPTKLRERRRIDGPSIGLPGASLATVLS